MLKPCRFDARLGIAGAVVISGQLIHAVDAQSDPRFYPGIDAQTGYNTRNLLAAPLLNLNGEVLGAFEVLNKTEGSFNRADEELLSAFAAQVAIAVETAAMVDELRGHNQQRAARALGVSRQGLIKKIKRYALNSRPNPT